MNDEFLPKSELEPEKDPKKVSNGRLAIWIIVGGVGLYLVGSGVWGIITGG
ncbi:hypothetical protein [Leifsonia sp. Root4]|jgi:hypothetical protein|uniref:hypothetical protein n=1 Tax=Leifsonia sp. Root4 TaxID=1736525 RepID=UPI000A7078C1|nr:hypothetical protein [Leifsonia sp. Root4]